ncbi:MAG TPA: SurA N-terminal domain-containing protein [Dissulfurispiraceae bacterium]|nr:SurA N-terminal domain-containing protein [Dissulfurispiraceae bacterium]
MLKSMRKHAKYFYVLFFVVIISFIFWGVGTKDKENIQMVAEIGKEKISVKDYWMAYERARDSYHEMYKDQPVEEIEKKLNLKQMVLNGLIDERVLLIAARELGLSPSDEDLQQAIINDPRFKRDGVFRKDIYVKTLALNRLTPEMYEGMLSNQLAEDRVRKLVISSVDVTNVDLAGAKVDESKEAMLKQMVLYSKRNAALKSFIDGMKAKLNPKINMEVLS